jgi:putative oxidoreductase
MTVTRLIARPMLASMFVLGSINALKNAKAHAEKAAPVTDRLVPLMQRVAPALPIPTDPVALVRLNAAVQLGAAAALATGHFPRISSAVLAGSLIPTTFAGHAYWNETDPSAKAMQRVQFFKNASILGGLIIAAGDTVGRPGLAWRARRAASDVRREAGQLTKDVRREAKLARAQLT